MADPARLRMYQRRIDRLRRSAAEQAESVAEAAASLAKATATEGRKAFGSDARNLAADALRLAEALAQVEILEEVSYLASDPTEEEKTDG